MMGVGGGGISDDLAGFSTTTVTGAADTGVEVEGTVNPPPPPPPPPLEAEAVLPALSVELLLESPFWPCGVEVGTYVAAVLGILVGVGVAVPIGVAVGVPHISSQTLGLIIFSVVKEPADKELIARYMSTLMTVPLLKGIDERIVSSIPGLMTAACVPSM